MAQALQPQIVLAVYQLCLRKLIDKEHLVDGLVESLDVRVGLLDVDDGHFLQLIVGANAECLHLSVNVDATHLHIELRAVL